MKPARSRNAQPDARTRQVLGAGMDRLVGMILMIGVLLSVVLLIAGSLWHRARAGSLSDEFELGGNNLVRFLWSEIRALEAGIVRPRVLISVGIGVLLLTPYIRVLASMIYFIFEERNLKYSLFTGFVLAVLTYSLMLH